MKSGDARQMQLSLFVKKSEPKQQTKITHSLLEKPAIPNGKMLTFEELIWGHHFAKESDSYLLAAKLMPEVAEVSKEEHHYLGQHLLAEFKVKSLNLTPEKLEEIIVAAAVHAKATVLDSRFFKIGQFGKNGISGIAVLKESHIAVHYSRKNGLLSLDVYTCGYIKFNLAVDYIINKLNISPYDQVDFKRGIQSINNNKFIPGIAYENADKLKFFTHSCLNEDNQKNDGLHAIVEFHNCNSSIINDAEAVLKIFQYALSDSKIEPLYQYTHQFQPQGVSVVLLGLIKGKPIQITIHDWPEYFYGAVDVRGSDNSIQIKQVIDIFQGAFNAKLVNCHMFPRGSHDAENELVPVFNKYKK